MSQFESTTISIYVDYALIDQFIMILKVVDDKPFNHPYIFNPSEAMYSDYPTDGHLQVNIPINLWIKFQYTYKFNQDRVQKNPTNE